tara:strand:+ start:486 stop:923 length:438 start_codon:yes stop_codon:yes gene_type:complete
MTTIRENILDELKSVLTGTTNVGSRIFRERVTPLANRNELPCLVIEPLNDNADLNLSLPKIDWTLTVTISVIVSGSSSTTPSEAADPIVESLHAKVVSDLTLGGYAIDVRPQSMEWEFLDSDQPTGIVTCTYAIRYRTSLTSLAS